jgi:hypothetical protein
MKKNLYTLALVIFVLLFSLQASADAACTQAIPTQAKGLFLTGGMISTHTYKIAFYQTTATWDATTTAYSATNEITGTNYSAGGYSLAGFVVASSGTTAYVDFTDNVQNNITFNQASTCAVIYDSSLTNASCTGTNAPYFGCTGAGTGTVANAAIYVGTFTSVQPSAGTLTTTFPTPDSSNAILRIAVDSMDWLFPSAEASARVDAMVKIQGIIMTSASK